MSILTSEHSLKQRLKEEDKQFFSKIAYTHNISPQDIPENGVIICTGHNAAMNTVLENSYWPTWAVLLEEGIVTDYKLLAKSKHSREPENMLGWTIKKIAEWTIYREHLILVTKTYNSDHIIKEELTP